jgi:uncharacterized membrane protein
MYHKGDINMHIRTKNKEWYVAEIHGPNFISWVQKRDKQFALFFPQNKVEQWLQIIYEMSGFLVEPEEVYNGTSGYGKKEV